MKKIVLKYGLISGAFCSLMMNINVVFANRIGFDRGLYLGYTIIVLSFLLVFFGIRSYRETEGGGQITFARAFGIGILITLITCICYVVTWEIIYFNFTPDFLDKYGAYVIAKAKESGVSEAALQAKMAELARDKALYNNVFYHSAETFMEPFPVGLLMTLISAAVLRKRPRMETAVEPMAASR
jgi:Protein of unknown function (DUF4199)